MAPPLPRSVLALALALVLLPCDAQPLLTPLLASEPLNMPLPLAMIHLSLAHLRNLVPALILRLRGPPFRLLDARVVVGEKSVSIAIHGEILGAAVIDGGWGLELVVGNERRRVVLGKRVQGDVGVVVGERGVNVRVRRDERIWWGWIGLLGAAGVAGWALMWVGMKRSLAQEEEDVMEDV